MGPMDTILMSLLCTSAVSLVAYLGILKQINAAIYSNAQSQWDEEVRRAISVLLLEIKNQLKVSFEISAGDMNNNYYENYTRLRLNIDPSKPNELALLKAINTFWEDIKKDDIRLDAYQKMYNELIITYRKIVGDEWKKHKRGY
jgi:hypothetical protein